MLTAVWVLYSIFTITICSYNWEEILLKALHNFRCAKIPLRGREFPILYSYLHLHKSYMPDDMRPQKRVLGNIWNDKTLFTHFHKFT